MLELILRDDTGATHTLRLDVARVVGRDAACDLALPTHRIDRRHTRFFAEGEQARVADEGSSIGTFLNGKIVRQPTVLSAGDQLRIGDAELTVVAINA